MSDGYPTFELFSNAQFEIGGEDQLAELRARHSAEPSDDDSKRRLDTDWEHLLADIHIRTGTLLKTDTVSFLLGAGASKECGGPLIGTIPVELERHLISLGITDAATAQFSAFIECFYLAIHRASGLPP